MDPTYLIAGAVFIGVVTLILAVSMTIKGMRASKTEDRLAAMTGTGGRGGSAGQVGEEILRDSIGSANGIFSTIAQRFSNMAMFFEQADSPLKFDVFLIVCAICSALSGAVAIIIKSPMPLIPVAAVAGFGMPWLWMMFRRKRRFARFEKQLPDALELISRALRSGHSLQSGLNVVASELPAPISTEFHVAYEEQNLGISIEGALKNMLKRIPNLDLKFFVTAVAIQRQAGGDLSEILDKISHIVRQRFEILGQVKALTGEGRISGVVLMGLPIALFFAVYYLNPSYVMILFEREEGRNMLIAAVVAQLFGAIVIKKIIDIKV